MTINVYDIDNVLVRSFTSQVAAAEWLDVSNVTVHNYIKSGKVWNKLYTLVENLALKRGAAFFFIYLFFLITRASRSTP
jgi:hypothetical protein